METINDIVREIATEMLNTSMQDITAERIHGWATRLGATCKESLRVGNAAKMREVLEWFWSKRSMLDFCHNNLSTKTWEDWDKVYCFLREFADKVQAALAEPLRNCDVGTAEEQGMRFKKFCNDHQAPWHGCTNCPVLMSEKCAIAWSQMPYESEVTK